MLNVDVARKALQNIWEDRAMSVEADHDDLKVLDDFVDEVERLLHYNAIKQTPALFKVNK